MNADERIELKFHPFTSIPGLPFSEAVDVGKLVFLSGQIGLDPATQSLAGDDFGAYLRRT